jgi:hypothetical protein
MAEQPGPKNRNKAVLRLADASTREVARRAHVRSVRGGDYDCGWLPDGLAVRLEGVDVDALGGHATMDFGTSAARDVGGELRLVGELDPHFLDMLSNGVRRRGWLNVSVSAADEVSARLAASLADRGVAANGRAPEATAAAARRRRAVAERDRFVDLAARDPKTAAVQRLSSHIEQMERRLVLAPSAGGGAATLARLRADERQLGGKIAAHAAAWTPVRVLSRRWKAEAETLSAAMRDLRERIARAEASLAGSAPARRRASDGAEAALSRRVAAAKDALAACISGDVDTIAAALTGDYDAAAAAAIGWRGREDRVAAIGRGRARRSA